MEGAATHEGADPTMEFKVNSPNVDYSAEYITSQYNYEKNLVQIVGNTGTPCLLSALLRLLSSPQLR